MNPLKQRLVEVSPHEDAEGRIVTHVIQDIICEATEEELIEENNRRTSLLWRSASDFEQSFISGSANNVVLLGVINNKPKAQAVQGWIQSIWTLYYERKELESYDCGFLVVGPCPHTIPELMAE